MTEVPDYQAWTNVINSVPTYSTMGTSPAIASSPLINPRPLVETVEDEEENTVGELAAAAELVDATLTAPSATTNLPTSPSIATAHALSQRHHQRPSHRACREALSANNELPRRMIVLLNAPACSNRDPLDGNLSGPPRATTSRSACVTTVTPTARRTLANHVLHVLPSRCSAHLGVLRHLPSATAASPTRNLLKIIAYLLPIILGASLLQSLGWLLDMVSRGQPSLMFLQHQEVACWVAWDQSYLSQAFLGLPGPSSRGIMDLGRLPGWESVSFF